MNTSWIIVMTMVAIGFSAADSNWFTKGTVTTVTHNENGEQIVTEREMTEEEKESLTKTLNEAKNRILGIGTKNFGGFDNMGDFKNHMKTSADEMRRSMEEGARQMKVAAENMKEGAQQMKVAAENMKNNVYTSFSV